MAIVKNVRPSAVQSVTYFAKPASTAFSAKTLVSPNEDATSNTFVAASATTQSILGALKKAVVSTDSDYASETEMSILHDPFGIFEFAVGTGTADINDEQGFIDLKDADEVDVEASALDTVFVTNFVSGTVVRGVITLWYNWNPPQMRA